ncbi:MAG: hypothetical protein WKF91_07525 [Segetibacter sp.]
MKMFIVYISFSIFFVTVLSCNNNPAKSEDDSINTKDVPAAVATSFKAKYPNATDVEWKSAKEDGDRTYKAKYKVEGKKIKAEFSTDGTFIKEQDD